MPVRNTALRSGACALNPAPRASVADVDADAVVQALHLAAAIFDDSGRLLSHNAAFATSTATALQKPCDSGSLS